MENSVGSTIEKIKLQEQDIEAKLRDKRELEAMVMSMNRAIRDATSQIQKLTEEHTKVTMTTGKLQAQCFVDTARRDALIDQVKACHKELDELRKLSDKGITKVWCLRSSLSEAVQKVSDECDIWALLTKPRFTDILPRTSKKKPENTGQELLNDGRLKLALERREKAFAERDRLLNEPDIGEEFVRIRNALRYSTEMSANLRN